MQRNFPFNKKGCNVSSFSWVSSLLLAIFFFFGLTLVLEFCNFLSILHRCFLKFHFLSSLDWCIQLYDIIKLVYAAYEDSEDALQPLGQLLDQAIMLTITSGKCNAIFFLCSKDLLWESDFVNNFKSSVGHRRTFLLWLLKNCTFLNGSPLLSQIVVHIVKLWLNIKRLLESTNLARMSIVSVL